MRLSIVAPLALVLAMGMEPAGAGVLGDNAGPSAGSTDAWGDGLDRSAPSSFTLWNAAASYGADFAVWGHPGETLASVDWALISNPAAGDTYAQGTPADIGQTSPAPARVDGPDVATEGFSIPALTLTAGTYWLLLQNAIVPDGEDLFWGRSDQSWHGGYGKLAGYSDACNGPCAYAGAVRVLVPEPVGFALLGMGLLGMATVLLRDFNG